MVGHNLIIDPETVYMLFYYKYSTRMYYMPIYLIKSTYIAKNLCSQ